MAKNYASIYASPNDSIALEQSFYLVQETTPGTLQVPLPTSFLFTLTGGQVNFSQPFMSSPYRSGRHNTGIIREKKELSWTLPTYVDIDTSLVSASSAEIGLAFSKLWESLLGHADLSAGAIFDPSTPPSITFSLYECGDRWSLQTVAAFVQGATVNLVGDGQANIEWTGNGKEALMIGIGKSTVDNNAGNVVTLQTDEGENFRIGGLVMLIEADGTTRSADTAANSYRRITGIAGDAITLSGAALADADGSTTPIYLVYAEPATKTAINNPQVGLQGSIAIAGLTNSCFRNATLTIANNHELVDYCYGADALVAPFFVPGARLDVGVSIEANLNEETIRFYNRIQDFEPQNITLILGDATTRHMEIDLPKVQFNVPSIPVPDTGSIPVTYEGTAFQSALDAADEITAKFI